MLVGRARVGLLLGLCCLLGRGWCCAGAWPPSWRGLPSWCVAPPMVGRAVLVRAPCPLWGVLCRCVVMVGRAVLACGPPLGRPCCCARWPSSWLGVLCRCVAPLMVERAVLVPVHRRCCAWCGGAWLGLSSCVPPGGPRWVRVDGARGGVSVGAVRGLFCLSCVVFAAFRSACSGRCGRRVGCGCGCVDRLAGVGSVLVRGPPHGWACCFGACPPQWWGVLCWCVAPPMVGRAALICGLPLGGACCVGACPPDCGRAVWVCAPLPRGRACCVGLWPPSWWGAVCWCVTPSRCGVPCWCLPAAVVVCGLGCRHLLGGLWLRFCCWLGRGWCCAGACPPPLLGRAVFVRAPPLGGACCVGLFEFRFVVL